MLTMTRGSRTMTIKDQELGLEFKDRNQGLST